MIRITEKLLEQASLGVVGICLVGTLAGFVKYETSFTRELLQINQSGENPACTKSIYRAVDRTKPVEPLYRVFRRDDEIIFRQIGYNCALSPSILAANIRGTLEGGIDDCIVQRAPARGIGAYSVCRGQPTFDRYERRFDSLVVEYKEQNLGS